LLRRVVNLSRQQDGPGACTEDSAATRCMGKQALVEAFLNQKFPLRGALTARQNDSVHAFEITRRADKHVLNAQAREYRRVRLKVSLNGKYSDFCGFPHRTRNQRFFVVAVPVAPASRRLFAFLRI